MLREMSAFKGGPSIEDKDRFDKELQENTIYRHALQVVASTLIDQRTHRERAIMLKAGSASPR